MNTGRLGLTLRLTLIALLLSLPGVLSSPVQPALAQQPEPRGVSLRVQTPDYKLDPRGVWVEGYQLNDLPGEPLLPFWSTVVELPADGGWWIEYDSPGVQTLAQTVAIAAVPVPDSSAFEAGLWFDKIDFSTGAPTIDRPDPAIYGVDAFYPSSPVTSGAEQWQRGKRLLALRVYPFQYNPVSGALRYHPDVQISIHITPSAGAPAQPRAALETSNPPASTPGALRIRTANRGLYRLTYNDLLAAGVPLATTNVNSFAMWYLGQPVAIEVTGDGDDQFEPGELAIFYAQPYQGRFQTDNVYWFTYGAAPGLRMATRAVTPIGSEPVVTTISQTVRVERNLVYETTFPLPSNADHWFDNRMSPDALASTPTVNRDYTITLDDPLFTGTARVQAALHGGAVRPGFDPDKSVAISVNNNLAATHQWQGMTYTTVEVDVPASWLTTSPRIVRLTASVDQIPGIEFYSIAPDWVSVTYPAVADAEGDNIYIEAVEAGANEVRVTGFTTATVQVYELRDPNQPVRILATAAEPAGGGYALSFWDEDLPGPTYYLSTATALSAPSAIEPDTPSSWGTPGHEADYIAIIHPSLWSAIDPLLAHRAAEGLRVAKVDVQDIYDEWSYGRRDPEAIRSFLSYAYRCWNGAPCDPPPASPPEPPQYVLLVGDGHYDFTGVSGTAFPNLLPPYLAHVDPWMGETLADNRYVSVDGPDDFLADMAIGRLPANSPAETTAMVDKIIAYETAAPDGPWQERVVFVADSNSDPAGNFHAYSDNVRLNWLPAGYDDRTIYYNLDYFTGPTMRTAVRTAFNDDALMIQWFGHASRYTWGAFTAFNVNDPPTLNANDTWPFTVHYTCYSGYFGNLAFNIHALGEVLVRTPLRGSIADLSSAGANLGGSLVMLNQEVTKAVVVDRIERAGPAVDQARLRYFQRGGGVPSVIDTFIFFGDPALKLRLPESRLTGSTLEASRAWAPPGMSVTFTATLTTTASASTAAQLALDLPANLDAPTALGASSSSAVYDPALHRVAWSGAVAPGAAEVVTFTSAVAAAQQSCGAVAVSGQVLDDLVAPASLHASVQLAVPDVDCDGNVDVADVQQVAARWGTATGDTAYHPRYDLDADDQIGVLDIIVVASLW